MLGEQLIESHIAAVLTVSTMGCAAIGNLISDVAGLRFPAPAAPSALYFVLQGAAGTRKGRTSIVRTCCNAMPCPLIAKGWSHVFNGLVARGACDMRRASACVRHRGGHGELRRVCGAQAGVQGASPDAGANGHVQLQVCQVPPLARCCAALLLCSCAALLCRDPAQPSSRALAAARASLLLLLL